MSRIQIIFTLVLTALVVAGSALSGSSYRLTQLPTPAEFSKPIEELMTEYPELADVFPAYATSERLGMAYIEEFIGAWGEPNKKVLSWWNLWPGNWPFFPQYLWYWRLSDKEVQCRIDHPFYEGWRKTVCNCTAVTSS